MSKRRLSPLTLRQIRKSKLRLVESLKHYEDKDSYDLTDYYFEKGLRKVYPYYFTFRSFAKGRWVSEKVLDVLTREFRSETVLDHARAIKQGRVTINGESIDEEYRFKNNDLLMSRVHRHELPVSDQKISIVHENDDMLVINKPASIPIHPAGRFRYNSLMFILAKEMNLKKLFSIHRLDRLTSGILLIGKNSHISKKIGDEIRAGLVKKVYLAVVDGEFPEGKTCCSQKINVMCPVIGLHCVDNSEEGAVCTTNFNRIFYDSSCNRSVIACYPETGRTHQIRIHSQFLGHPIVQDPLYNSDAWGSEKGKGGIDVNSRESIVRHLRELHANATREGNWRFRDQYLIDDNKIHKEKYTCEPNLQDCDDNEHKTVHKYYDASCPECQVKFRDPTFEEMEIFLHAYIYSGQSWSFKAPLPHWMEKYKQYLTEDLLYYMEDPFFLVKQDVENSISRLFSLYDSYANAISVNSSTDSKKYHDELKTLIKNIEWDLEDLDETVLIVKSNPRKFKINNEELNDRIQFVVDSRKTLEGMRLKLTPPKTQPNEVKSNKSFSNKNSFKSVKTYKYSKLDAYGEHENDQFFSQTEERQKLLIEKQDEELDMVANSIGKLKFMGHEIGNELDEHNVLLDDLSHEMDSSSAKLDFVANKMAKLTRLSNDKRQWTAILILGVSIFILMILLIIL